MLCPASILAFRIASWSKVAATLMSSLTSPSPSTGAKMTTTSGTWGIGVDVLRMHEQHVEVVGAAAFEERVDCAAEFLTARLGQVHHTEPEVAILCVNPSHSCLSGTAALAASHAAAASVSWPDAVPAPFPLDT